MKKIMYFCQATVCVLFLVVSCTSTGVPVDVSDNIDSFWLESKAYLPQNNGSSVPSGTDPMYYLENIEQGGHKLLGKKISVVFTEVSAQDYQNLIDSRVMNPVLTAMMKDIFGNTWKGALYAASNYPGFSGGSTSGNWYVTRLVCCLGYNPEQKTAYSTFWIAADPGIRIKKYPDTVVISRLIDSLPYNLSGYNVSYTFIGNNKKISGSADGKIVIDILLDSQSDLTVGNLSGKTDSRGYFHFAGRSSMSKIGEGIILLIDDAGKSVEVKQNPEGVWFVQIQGYKGGKNIQYELPVDALNAKK